MKKKLFCLILGICIILFPTIGIYATEENKILKVGFYEQEGYFEKGSNFSGFGVEYLNSIAKYTGWNYEFVEGTREECLQWIENGNIDLFFPIYTNADIPNVYLSSRIIGEDYCYLYKSSNNFEVSHEDFEIFKDCVVGVVSGSGIEEKIEEYCEKKGFRFDSIVVYPSLEEVRQDLADGKIDLIAADSYVNLENMEVVGSFVSGLITFASSQEEIIAELDAAMDEIKLSNPRYAEELRARYFGEGSQKNLEYSAEEIEFLSQDLKYKVALCKEQYPISFFNEEGVYCGIAVDILTTVKYYTNISFEYIYVDSYDEGEELLQNGNVDILAGTVLEKQDIYDLNEAKENDSIAGFFEMDLAFIGKEGIDLSEKLNVAISSYMEKSLLYLEEKYPQYNFIVYDNDEACFDAIVNKETELAVQTDTKINELSIYDEYKDIRKLKNIPADFMVAFTIKAEEPMLVDVMNKTLSGLSEAAISDIENNNMEHIERKGMTIEEFLEYYFWDIMVSVIVVLGILLSMIMYVKYKREQKSKEKAYRDSVADVSSMEKFRLDIAPMMEGSAKDDYFAIAVDLDKFKVINDLYGYDYGDRVIAFLAKKLKEDLKPQDYITRISADNFLVFKAGSNINEIYQYLDRVFKKVDDEIARVDRHFRMILKAGIYRIRKEDQVLSNIIDKANLAKRNMKKSHRSSYNVYSDEMRQKNIEDKNIENDMEEAIRTGQFRMYLQPQIDLATKEIVSAEALVRWIHPEKGMISPIKFIPVFENNGFITRLDLFVWEEAIKTISRWKNEMVPAVPIAINLSRVDMEREGMIESLIELMKKYKLESEWIKTELTESVYLENETLILDQMTKLKKFGFKIAVDDFGSGYSSLHLLKSMPVDILKIDKSFLDISPDMKSKEEILIRDVVDMGKHLELQIIMEGVETLEQSDFLEAIGCDLVQGYYYGKPMSVEDFEKELLKKKGQEVV